MKQQITDTILMVRPAHFGFNPTTAESNAFQSNDTALSSEEIRLLAIQEFDQLVAKLYSAKIDVIVIEDTEDPIKYDAVFPNNWFSTHDDGSLVFYPMFSPMRRLERRPEIFEVLAETHHINQRIHFEQFETEDAFLESTGSIILDRPNNIGYACRSVRTNQKVVEAFCERMRCKAFFFDAVDVNEQLIYHTNVIMAIGETFVIMCMDSVKNGSEYVELLQHFARTNKTLIEISLAQMECFAGNMLQVRNRDGETFLVMSEQAYQSLLPEQIDLIEQHTNILYSPVYIIEQFGGGSVRCMMAEIFLPKKTS
ncbi:MAG: arginine deiminase-related protein [Bacteroidota bacterium]